MAKRVILAVAGAGKTYHICHEINPQKRNLIVAFTHENIKNIQKELLAEYGEVPEKTRIMTFDSFVYHMLIRPYEASIFDFFDEHYNFIKTDITLQKPPAQRIKVNGRDVPNKKYKKKENLGHYLNDNQQYYCETLSELAVYVKNGSDSLIRKAAERINKFFDQVMIDEFQDFRKYDYELIVGLSKFLTDVLLVGDYYQHSVSGQNNSGKPFKKGKAEVSYEDFIEELRKNKFDVDETSLIQSRRCSEEICLFVRNKLGIQISSANINQGMILRPDNVRTVIEDKDVVKLVYDKAARYSFNAVNWSYSKGDTYNKACVILNGITKNLMENNFSASKLKAGTLNKLYVALTRSKGDLYIILPAEFDEVKDQYLKDGLRS